MNIYTALLVIAYSSPLSDPANIPIQGVTAAQANSACLNLKAQYEEKAREAKERFRGTFENVPLTRWNYFSSATCLLAEEPKSVCTVLSPGPLGIVPCTPEQRAEFEGKKP